MLGLAESEGAGGIGSAAKACEGGSVAVTDGAVGIGI